MSKRVMSERIQLVIISKFWKGDKGICTKCHGSFPIEEMKVSAFAEPDIPGGGLIRELYLYCSSCYSKLEALGKLFTG